MKNYHRKKNLYRILYLYFTFFLVDCTAFVKEAEQAESVDAFSELTISNLKFRYAENNQLVLNNVNLHINKGEKIAFVGYNGAGKTTLIKLIMRLYDPMEGNICWNKKDIRELSIKEYRAHIGTVFQDFKLFAVSVAENVKADKVEKTENNRILGALKKSGLEKKIKKITQGIDAEVTREFDDDGIIFSGGEQQKLAIARAIMKDADLFIYLFSMNHHLLLIWKANMN